MRPDLAACERDNVRGIPAFVIPPAPGAAPGAPPTVLDGFVPLEQLEVALGLKPAAAPGALGGVELDTSVPLQ